MTLLFWTLFVPIVLLLGLVGYGVSQLAQAVAEDARFIPSSSQGVRLRLLRGGR